MTKVISRAISSNYLNYDIDEDIVIYEGRFGIYIDKKYRCNGIIYYKMSQPTSISFRGKILHTEIEEEYYDLNLNYDNAIIDIYGFKPTYVTISSINELFLEGYINEHKIQSKNAYVDYIDFDIINLDNLPGNLIKYEDKLFAGRFEFDYNDFHILIDKRYDYRKELKEELKSKNGFLITHTGRITRIDNKKFKTNNIIDTFDILSYSLSFICGRYVSISNAKGYNSGNNLYRIWMENIITPYRFIPTWTDTIANHHNIEKFMSLMCKQLEDSYYGFALKRVIDWYIESLGNISLENNIISIQIALESLSYIILVEKEFIISKDVFDSNNASKNIKLILSHLKIPHGNEELELFDNWVKGRFDDGVDLIIYYRNKIVHPARKDNPRSLTVEDMWNIIQIGTRYIELIILSLINYKGEYSNRLKERWFGEVDLVPWNNMQ